MPRIKSLYSIPQSMKSKSLILCFFFACFSIHCASCNTTRNSDALLICLSSDDDGNSSDVMLSQSAKEVLGINSLRNGSKPSNTLHDLLDSEFALDSHIDLQTASKKHTASVISSFPILFAFLKAMNIIIDQRPAKRIEATRTRSKATRKTASKGT